MLIDDIREQLKIIEPDIATITTYWKNSGLDTRYHDLTTHSNQENFGSIQNKKRFSKSYNALKLSENSI